jgi:hypothetical protein
MKLWEIIFPFPFSLYHSPSLFWPFNVGTPHQLYQMAWRKQGQVATPYWELLVVSWTGHYHYGCRRA